jgi:hypothetical protein
MQMRDDFEAGLTIDAAHLNATHQKNLQQLYHLIIKHPKK